MSSSQQSTTQQSPPTLLPPATQHHIWPPHSGSFHSTQTAYCFAKSDNFQIFFLLGKYNNYNGKIKGWTFFIKNIFDQPSSRLSYRYELMIYGDLIVTLSVHFKEF